MGKEFGMKRETNAEVSKIEVDQSGLATSIVVN